MTETKSQNNSRESSDKTENGTSRSGRSLLAIREIQEAQPFKKKLKSLNCAAILLSYFGHKSQVWSLLQLISHESRAYLV